MDLALEKFASEYPRHAQVVEFMFFGGLNATETAQVLGGMGEPVSPRTVERDWRFARCWLQNEVARARSSRSSGSLAHAPGTPVLRRRRNDASSAGGIP